MSSSASVTATVDPRSAARNLRHLEKRSVDIQIIGEWVEPGSRVLDLGCGRGVLLEFLEQTKEIFGVGVDLDLHKVLACVRKGVNVYQGDMETFMKSFPDGFFDRVICSRTLQELSAPADIILEALRLARNVTIGFVNFGFWKNRLNALLHGRKMVNEVFPTQWYESRPANPVSVADFEAFCDRHRIEIVRKVYLAGDWKKPCHRWPNLRAGYALYDLQLAKARGGASPPQSGDQVASIP